MNCECQDPGCPEHLEDYRCPNADTEATHTLIDAETGATLIECCQPCGQWAVETLDAVRLEAL